MSVYDIALSGLNASKNAVSVHAQNIANAQSGGRVNPGAGQRSAYIPVDIVSISQNGNGVSNSVSERVPASVNVFSPDSADADENGLIAMPNVSIEDEIIGSMVAKQTYTANAKVISIQSEMDKELLNILS